MITATSNMISIGNETASLSVDLYGGSITNFSLRDGGINPLTFKYKPADMPEHNRSGASYRGHFICLGRWGAPTSGEINAGIPDHGQAANMIWEHTTSIQKLLKMQVLTPLEGLHIKRVIEMDDVSPVFKVGEYITNVNPLSRLYNVVQHPTLAKPFLTNNTIVNCNADRGFNYRLSTKPLQHAAKWPYGIMEDGGKMNISRADKAYSSVFSYTVEKDAQYGWITAYSPEFNLLLGYLWRRETYPWLSLWQDFDGPDIRYRGLEFGTTGMHKPYKQIIDEGNHEVFGERSYLMIDAGEMQQKNYLGFMTGTPDNFTEVSDVNLANGQISIKEPGGRQFDIKTTLSL
jgi:hypothetical protein